MGRSVRLDKLEPGMVVAADVRARNGSLLVPAGATLGSAHLKTLKTWGVSHVNVVVDGDADLPIAGIGGVEHAFADEAAAKDAALDRFRNTDLTHPVVQALHAEVLRRYLKWVRKPSA